MAGALCVFGLAFAAPAGAVAAVTSERAAGADRYATAADVCDKAYPNGAANVLLATGQGFADALAGSALAGDRNTCILLTPTASLDGDTAAQITQMKGLTTALTSVTILGGTSAVSAGVATAVEALGVTVDRVEGPTRYETAGAIDTAIGTAGAIGGEGTALIARGDQGGGGVDALAAGPVAARGDGTNPFPTLLVPKDGPVPAATIAALADIDNVIILGGTAAISATTAAAVATAAGDATPTRLEGATREATAVAVAEFAEDMGFGLAEVLLANGRVAGQEFSPDALVAGPLGDVRGAPVLLVQGVDLLGTNAQAFLDLHSDTIAKVTAIGGTNVISTAVLAAAEVAAETVSNDSNQAFTVAPATAQTNETDANAATGASTFTVTDITTTTVDIALVPCENVTATGNTISFADGETNGAGNNAADNVDNTTNDTAANIETVNGAANPNGDDEYADNVAVVNGAVQFTVDSDTVDCVRAVIFNDADNDEVLELNAGNQPVDPFVITGEITFVPPAAGNVAVLDENVATVDNAADSFSACEITSATGIDSGAPNQGIGGGVETVNTTDCLVYTYDSSDRFFVDADVDRAFDPIEQVTLAEFEALLSPNDDIGGDYNATAALQSSFILFDEAPTAPVISVANVAGAENTSQRVTIATPSVPGPDVYTVYRAAGTCAGAAFPADFTQVGTITPPATTLTVTGLTPSTDYCYVATATDEGDTGAVSGEIDATTAATATTDTTAPVSNDAIVSSNGPGLAGTFDTGDVVKLVFNEAMQAPSAGDTIRASDPDGTLADFICGTNATCTINAAAETVNGVSRAANTVVTLVLTGAPTPAAAGTTAGLQLDGTITDAGGYADLGGNVYNPVAAQPDKLINSDLDDTAAFTGAAPTFDSITADDSDNTVTLTFSEAILCSTVSATAPVNPDFTVTADGTSNETIVSVTCTGASDATITVAVTGVVATDNFSVTLTSADAYTDVDGNPVTGTLTRGAVAVA